MKLLALDTSSTVCSVALLDSDKPINEQIISLEQSAAKQQGRLVLPMIHALLQSAELSLNKLDGILFGCGPGSFTGVRIASTVVQGLAYAANLPIMQVSSLAALAQSAYQANLDWKNILVAIDARMQKVYWAIYRANNLGFVELIGNEDVYNPKIKALENEKQISAPFQHVDLNIDSLQGETWVGIGDGWELYAESITKRLGFEPCVIYPQQQLKASALFAIAKGKISKGEWLSPKEALPVYLS